MAHVSLEPHLLLDLSVFQATYSQTSSSVQLCFYAFRGFVKLEDAELVAANMAGPSSVGFASWSHVVLVPSAAPWSKTPELPPGAPKTPQRPVFGPHEKEASSLDEEITVKTKITSLEHKDQVVGLRKELVEEDWMA